jgi:AcrR family transcriptional regulator
MTIAALRAGRPGRDQPPKRPARKVGRRTFTKSPDATRAGILAAAAMEFAEHGFSGARVDVITAQTNTSKRMIYYYFGSKEELYRHVLQESYRALRLREGKLELENLTPIKALEKIVEFNFNHHMENEHFIRMVMNENVLMGRNIRQIPFIREENASVIELLREICEKGAVDGSMRPQIDPVDLHMSISALCVFNVANRHTFSYLFDRDMTTDAATTARRRSVVELIIGGVSPAAVSAT